MKNKLFALSLAVSSVSLMVVSAFGGSAGLNTVTGVTVESGQEQTLDEDVKVGYGGVFRKNGAGKLTVPMSKVSQNGPGYTLQNLGAGGTLRLEAGADATAQSAPSVLNRAALWLTPDSLVTTNGDDTAYIARWCDEREPTATRDLSATPTRNYAYPAWGSLTPEANSNRPPVKVTQDGRVAAYFGGHASGKFMKFTEVKGVRHSFLVHGMYDCLGTIVGHGTSRSGGMLLDPFAGDLVKPTLHITKRPELSPPYVNARSWKDGEPLDPQATAPICGFQLLAFEFPNYADAVNRIFRTGFAEIASGNSDKDKVAQGGDYVSEIILFTNVITEAERVDVERYLMRKYSLPMQPTNSIVRYNRPSGAIETAAQTTTEFYAGENETNGLVTLKGAGAVVKKGAGAMLIGPGDPAHPFTGTFAFEEGEIIARGGCLPAVKASAGETLCGARDYNGGTHVKGEDALSGTKLTRTTAGAAGTVEKTGNECVRVNEITADVSKLYVRAGELKLESKITPTVADYAADAPISVTVPNGDFEMNFTYGTDSNKRGTLNSNPDNGWTGSGWYVAYTNSASWAWFGSVPSTPVSGNHVLLLNGGGYTAQVDVTIPQAGNYELSFHARGRYQYAKIGYVQVLFGPKDGTLAQIGQILPPYAGYRRFRLQLPEVTSAGTYTLKLYCTKSGYDGATFIDDVEIHSSGHRVATAAMKVPNGDFELIDFNSYGEKVSTSEVKWKGAPTVLNVPTGWNLDVASSCYPQALTNSAVHLASRSFTISGNSWSTMGVDWMMPGSTVLEFLHDGATATSQKFTLPAGTYKLRADFLRTTFNIRPSGYKECDCTYAPKFTATVTLADDSSVSLGNVEVTSRLPTSGYWPNAFTLETEQQVSITLGNAERYSSGNVDNLELMAFATAAEDENLFKDGSAESGITANLKTSADTSFYVHSVCGTRSYSDRGIYYGNAASDGERYFYFQSKASLGQDIAFASTGLYRLTCHMATRTDSTSYCNNDFHVWYVKSGTTETNWVDTVPMHHTPNYQEHSWLINIKEAGTYRVGFSTNGYTDSPTADRESHLDAVDLRKVSGTVAEAPSVPSGMTVSVSEGARLILDYPGNITVSSLRLGGHGVSGTVTAQTHPDYIGGAGSITVVPRGCMIFIR